MWAFQEEEENLKQARENLRRENYSILERRNRQVKADEEENRRQEQYLIQVGLVSQVEAEKRAVQIRHQEQIRFDRERQIRQEEDENLERAAENLRQVEYHIDRERRIRQVKAEKRAEELRREDEAFGNFIEQQLREARQALEEAASQAKKNRH
jgi:hypothetical protein